MGQDSLLLLCSLDFHSSYIKARGLRGQASVPMSAFLFHYDRIPATTWVYLSSLLVIAVYFKFSRLWSVRNLDLFGLILLAPGLLMVEYGRAHIGNEAALNIERLGFVWLFCISGFFLIRLLVDPLMVRRPLLEPNLSVGGQTFACVSLFLFLMANVLTGQVTKDDQIGAQMADGMRQRQQLKDEGQLATHGPGYQPLFLLPVISTQTIFPKESADPNENNGARATGQPAPASPTNAAANPSWQDEARYDATARTVAILSHLAIVIGMIMIGYRHFDNIKTGIAAATLYLLLPYTALLTGHVGHALPAALLIWAVETYRKPLVSGMLIGLAIGVIYYPAFLLPLWISFYWKRGLGRFLLGVISMVLVLAGTLAFRAADFPMFLELVRQMFGWRAPTMSPGGLWQFTEPFYRIPVLTAYVAMCISFAIWPAQKNLGTLMSCSAAVMLGTQFWHAHGGGLYMAWFLPLVLLTVFRPNLEDRVALAVLGEGWSPRNRLKLRAVGQAA